MSGTSGGGYSMNKKAVVVTFLARMRIYDEVLFQNFFKILGSIMSSASKVVQIPTYGRADEALLTLA